MGPPNQNQWTLWVGLTLLSSIVFTLWPELDLKVSGLFYDPEQSFWLGHVESVNLIREALYGMMLLAAIVSLIGFSLGLIRITILEIPTRVWGFIFTLFLIGPGLIANVLLKGHWGRARPVQTTEFGGDLIFTPALQLTDQCARNCSFVSGEGSGATALGISFAVLVPYLFKNASKRTQGIITRVFWVIPTIAIVLRVMLGRHFVSDTVFAILIVWLVAMVLNSLVLGRMTRVDEPAS